MQGIKARNVFIQPHTANLKHKIEEFRRTRVIKDLSRVKVFIIESQQHQFTSVTALPALSAAKGPKRVKILGPDSPENKFQTAAFKLAW